MTIHVHRASPRDAEILTAIAFAAKRHWGYSEEMIELWRDELTIAPSYIAANRVFSAVAPLGTVGVAALAEHDADWWLDHMWVWPAASGQGVGRRLLDRIVGELSRERVERLKVIADPNAVGFYERLGFRRVGEHPSKPAGRMLPVLEFSLPQSHVTTS